MSTFATVKPSALTPAAREVLAMATAEWRRMPTKYAATISELERFGLVETRADWQWSTRNSGAGRHVVFWRRASLSSAEGTKPLSSDARAAAALRLFD